MSVFDKIQNYSAKTQVASDVFDITTPKGAFLSRVHNSGYSLYSFMYKMFDGSVLSAEGKAIVDPVIENLHISEEVFFSLSINDRACFERVVVYSELYNALTAEGNLLVNAIAGGGKSSFLIFKIMYDIVTGESMCLKELPTGSTVQTLDKIWVCTFLNSGAAELQTSTIKWQRKLGYTQTADYISFSTLDAEFKRCLNAMGVATNIGKPNVLSQLLREAIDSCNVIRADGNVLTKEDYQILSGIITYRRGRLDDKRYQHPSCKDYNLTPTVIDLIVSQFASKRTAKGIMDFDEIQELLYQYLYVTPNKAVQDFVANRYKYIYIDEFQDTSQMQYAILKFYCRGKLWANCVGDESKLTTDLVKNCSSLYTGMETKGKVIVIGDPSQCFPEGTLLYGTSSVRPIPIEDFEEGNLVRSIGGGKYDVQCRTTLVTSNAIRSQYHGNLITCKTRNNCCITATTMHKVFRHFDSVCNILSNSVDFGRDFGSYVHVTTISSVGEFMSSIWNKVPNDNRYKRVSSWLNVNFDHSLSFRTVSDFKIDSRLFFVPHVLDKLYDAFEEVALCNCNIGDKLLTVEPETNDVAISVISELNSEPYDGAVYDINTKNKVFVVGGVVVHNCIYSFKGSDSKILTKYFDEDFRPTHCALSYNYRCPSNILKPIVPSIHKNTDSASQKILPFRNGGEMHVYGFNNYKTMVQTLLDNIKKDVDSGMSVAVLCRTNFDGAIPAFALESERFCNFSISGDNMTLSSPLPRKLMHVSSLFTEKSTPAVKDTLTMLTPRQYAYAIKGLVDTLKMNNLSIWDLPAEDIQYSCPWLTEFIKGVKSVFMYDGVRHKDKELDALSFVYQWLMTTTFKGDSTYALNARAYIDTLLYILSSYDFQNVYEYLEELDIINQRLEGRIGKTAVPVRIATVHEFKGKECDSVYIWNDTEGVFPSAKCILDDEDQLAEERRVHYIACTRAKHKETILALNGRMSMFVKEMDVSVETPVQLKATLGGTV